MKFDYKYTEKRNAEYIHTDSDSKERFSYSEKYDINDIFDTQVHAIHEA